MAVRLLLLMGACLLCPGCRAADPSDQRGPASSVADPQSRDAGANDAADRAVLFAYYFHRAQRCSSCRLIESMAAYEIEEHFAHQLQKGQIIWTSVSIEDPGVEVLRQHFDVPVNGLVLVRMEDGEYRDAKRLDELWALVGNPDAFSKCLVDEIHARLSPPQDR
ncbi:MAG TPA: nitrophenyl compound nitroreductase subunit ArsF family protein [Sedimentisphaerales bacterium]|nr:nitrophenyl compound nitroreductase subunit ArsF family protein [Sedimentisphaerales bacterium]HRV49187.1 nitrophenyl compound nitroreductase subunit ArsF family protein [Sedimentisphaerales bacterium]